MRFERRKCVATDITAGGTKEYLDLEIVEDVDGADKKAENKP